MNDLNFFLLILSIVGISFIIVFSPYIIKTILLLLLMTSFCLADTKTLSNTHMLIDVTPEGSLKLSCQDGYKLEGSLSDRVINRKCKKLSTNDSTKFSFCLDAQILTDAELQCVKETK